MSCTSCFEVALPECPETITVKAGLAESTDYYAIVTDKFGAPYAEQITTDADGNFEFDSTVLPAGSFNRHAGPFIMEVKSALTSCDPEELTFCVDGGEKMFVCIVFWFIEMNVDPGPPEAVIGCDCP